MKPRSKPQGRAHRDKLRSLVVARLSVGCRVPSRAILGKLLGISGSEAGRHMHRTLAECGVVTERRGQHQRIFVVSL